MPHSAPGWMPGAGIGVGEKKSSAAVVPLVRGHRTAALKAGRNLAQKVFRLPGRLRKRRATGGRSSRRPSQE